MNLKCANASADYEQDHALIYEKRKLEPDSDTKNHTMLLVIVFLCGSSAGIQISHHDVQHLSCKARIAFGDARWPLAARTGVAIAPRDRW